MEGSQFSTLRNFGLSADFVQKELRWRGAKSDPIGRSRQCCYGHLAGWGGFGLYPNPITELRFSLQIIVRDNNIDQALKALKKKMQREGIFREMKLRGAYEKPSEKRTRERAEAVRRHRKLLRKRMQRDGLLPRPKPR